LKALQNDHRKEQDCLDKAKLTAAAVFAEVCQFMEKNHKDEYPAAFSKSLPRCQSLVNALRPPNEIGKNLNLFGGGT
jgi:hypothetical protein